MLDDETPLYDSRVIVEYLSARTPVNHLLPSEHKLKIEVLRWEALADGVCDAAVAIMLEQRKPENQQSELVLKTATKSRKWLGCFKYRFKQKKWCVNETFSLADIAVGCLLGYIDLRLTALNWQDQYPNLAKHFTILSKRPSFKDTEPSRD